MYSAKKFLLHFTIWIAWFASQSISSLIDIENFPIWPAAYNYLSLIVVFYITYYAVKNLCNNISFYKAAKMKGIKLVSYVVFRPQAAKILLIAAIYPVCSWFYDGFMVAQGYLPYRYPDFFKYIDGRWGRESLYICIAIMIAVFRFMYRKKDSIIRSQRAQNKMLFDHLNKNDKFLDDLQDEVREHIRRDLENEE